MNFEAELKENVARVKTILRRYLPPEEGFQKTLLEAMNYSMLSGGKRLRPSYDAENLRNVWREKPGDRARLWRPLK